jgi:hypothetical protein
VLLGLGRLGDFQLGQRLLEARVKEFERVHWPGDIETGLNTSGLLSASKVLWDIWNGIQTRFGRLAGCRGFETTFLTGFTGERVSRRKQGMNGRLERQRSFSALREKGGQQVVKYWQKVDGMAIYSFRTIYCEKILHPLWLHHSTARNGFVINNF